MAKIILNNEEFDFTGYNRNIYFGEDNIMSSTAYINNLEGTNIVNRLTELSETTIISIAIKVNENIIYNLTNINAKITSMGESYNGVDKVNINLNLQFS